MNCEQGMDKTPDFGWRAVFKGYTLKDFLKDSIIPFVVSLLIITCTLFLKVDPYYMVNRIAEIGLSVIPLVLSLVIAAYVLFISAIMSQGLASMKKQAQGLKTLHSINSGFAACILTFVVASILFVVISIVSNNSNSSPYADIINYVISFVEIFLVIFAFRWLTDIVEDMFNMAEFSLYV